MGGCIGSRGTNILSISNGISTYHLNLSDPVSNGEESLSIGDVIDQQDALSAAEIRSSNSSESLLAGSVPNLELDALAV